MSSSTPAVPASGVQDIDKITAPASEADKNETAIGLLGKLKAYILDHKAGVSNLLQTVGSASLVLGGAALLFTGIAGILTVGGTPLGVPLLIAGGILSGVGTIFKIAEKVGKTDSITGEKIKEFFKDTLHNITKGTILAAAALGLCKVAPLETLILVAPIVIKLIPFLSKDLNDPKEWKKFVETFPEGSTIRKELNGTTTLNDALEKIVGPIKIMKSLIESTEDRKEPSVGEKGNAQPPAEKPDLSEKVDAKAEKKVTSEKEEEQPSTKEQASGENLVNGSFEAGVQNAELAERQPA